MRAKSTSVLSSVQSVPENQPAPEYQSAQQSHLEQKNPYCVYDEHQELLESAFRSWIEVHRTKLYVTGSKDFDPQDISRFLQEHLPKEAPNEPILLEDIAGRLLETLDETDVVADQACGLDYNSA